MYELTCLLYETTVKWVLLHLFSQGHLLDVTIFQIVTPNDEGDGV